MAGERLPRRPLVRTWLSGRGAFLAWTCAAVSLPVVFLHDKVAAGAWSSWILGLAVHWQWLYFVGGLLGCALALLGRRWHTVAAAAIVIVAWTQTSPAIERDLSSGGTPQGDTLTLATANLNFDSKDFARLEAWLTTTQAPQVVVLQEFTPRAQEAVQRPAVVQAYPHRVLAAQWDQFGLAILSRLPIRSSARVEPAAPTSTLALRSTIAWSGREIALTALHPMPPISGAYAAARDVTILQEARRLGESGAPALIAGDLNDTPWSSGLRGAAPWMKRATGLVPSWPNAGGWLSVLPLDHVLATPAWATLGSVPGPDLGSDHRPVIVWLRLKTQAD